MSDHTPRAAAVIDWLGDDIERGVRSDDMRTAIVTEPTRLSDTETMVSRSFPLGLLRVPQNSSGRPEHHRLDRSTERSVRSQGAHSQIAIFPGCAAVRTNRALSPVQSRDAAPANDAEQSPASRAWGIPDHS